MPSLPDVAARVIAMAGDSEPNLKEINRLILSDPVLATEVLRLSNSALFALRGEVRSILQALAILGTERIKGVACTIALRSYAGNALQIPSLRRCWRHNLAAAVLCAEFAEWTLQDAGEAYTGAILHDIGRLGLIAIDPEKYVEILHTAFLSRRPVMEVEREQYAMDHAEAGAWLAASWGLPDSLVVAVGAHHNATDDGVESLSGLVQLACRAADHLGYSVCDGAELPAGNPIEPVIARAPEFRRQRLRTEAGGLEALVAERVNSLET